MKYVATTPADARMNIEPRVPRIGLSLDGYAHFDGAVRVLVRGS